MNIVENHIAEFLDDFVRIDDPVYNRILNAVQSDTKQEYEPLLQYIYRIIIETRKTIEVGINCLHLSFEEHFSEKVKSLIAEFLTIEQFYYHSQSDTISKEANSYLEQKKAELNRDLKKLSNCPEGASGKNGGNKQYKNWQASKLNVKKLIAFYDTLQETSSLTPKVIFNCQVNFGKELSDSFEGRPFLVTIDELPKTPSYCIANFEETLNKLDSVEGLVDNLETVILFDCERKGIMTNFSFDEIEKWNREYETFFKRYIIVTFGKGDHAVHSVQGKIDLVRTRFKMPVAACYTILSSEVDTLLKRGTRIDFSTEFFGVRNSAFWDEYFLETNLRDLYELKSLKMMNVYSLAFNDDIRNYIVDDIFSSKITSKLISSATKQIIAELREDDRIVLKNSLCHALDLYIPQRMKESITARLRPNSILLLPDVVRADRVLLSKLSIALVLSKGNSFETWSTIDSYTDKPIIILCYRDQGHPPYHFYPNIIESKFQNVNNIDALFVSTFFGNQFEWAKFNNNQDLVKCLSHQIRKDSFEWRKLKSKIELTRPAATINIDWGVENEYALAENRETIKVKFSNSWKSKIYSPADLFIVRYDGKPEYRVERLSVLLNYDLKDTVLDIQNLDEIQEDINIYEKIVDLKQQESELEIIRNQLNVADTDPTKIWKILLKNIVDVKGYQVLYNELDEYLKERGARLVSSYHFKNNWINVQSDTISPINNKVFIAICDYLDIPRVYYVIMQRIKNASKQASRQSTRQMNHLLKDLFNDGCFDDRSNVRSILNARLPHYNANHPINELGIDESSLLGTIETLVELISPELKLIKVESIEKVEQ